MLLVIKSHCTARFIIKFRSGQYFALSNELRTHLFFLAPFIAVLDFSEVKSMLPAPVNALLLFFAKTFCSGSPVSVVARRS